MRKLEQFAAIVVAAGLAIVSYWLFFSWAGGSDGYNRRRNLQQEPKMPPAIKVLLSP
ncbi:putative membrane protein [cyanobiont of Ornithocercus magnificus]|nr:putative membrane protein [cyanobiont of Ornithocercus magnificus]